MKFESLEANVDQVLNTSFSHAIRYLNEHEHKLVAFLHTITPLFPCFISEFKAGTLLGLTESLAGLFQNAKTIRNNLSYHFAARVAIVLRVSEEVSIHALLREHISIPHREMWTCSSNHADYLRERSWGISVVRTTVPHPLEYLNVVTSGTSSYNGCSSLGKLLDYVTV